MDRADFNSHYLHAHSIIVGMIVFWLPGVLFIGLRLLHSIWKTSRLIYNHSDIDASELRLPHIPKYVMLVWNPNISVPITLGVFRPVLLLPSAAVSWPSAQLRSVIMHELAHIQRKDCLTQILVQIICAVYWYDPLVWWVARQIRKEAENACDDSVITQGVAATDYAEHLVQIAKSVRSLKFGSAVVAMAHQSKISERVTAILDQSRDRNPINTEVWHRSIAAGVPVLILLATFTPLLYGQPQYIAHSPIIITNSKMSIGNHGISPPAGHPEVAEAQMRDLYRDIQIYRKLNYGHYPLSSMHLYGNMWGKYQQYGIVVPANSNPMRVVDAKFRNPDTRDMNEPYRTSSPFELRHLRHDGTAIGTPKSPGTRDILILSSLYVHQEHSHLTGFYLVLWDDGTVDRVPCDKIIPVMGSLSEKVQMKDGKVIDPMQPDGVAWTVGIPGEAGLPQ